MSSIPKIALMIHNESSADLLNNVLRKAANIQKLTEVEQINLENEWTEFVKNLVGYGNKHYLRNFSLKLEVEVDDDDTERLGGH
jgi:hypothetical protein